MGQFKSIAGSVRLAISGRVASAAGWKNRLVSVRLINTQLSGLEFLK
jgi:hypothetical protein